MLLFFRISFLFAIVRLWRTATAFAGTATAAGLDHSFPDHREQPFFLLLVLHFNHLLNLSLFTIKLFPYLTAAALNPYSFDID